MHRIGKSSLRKAQRGVFAIVVLDQEPLRRSAAAHCTDAMAHLEQVRVGWHQFEREDKPAFARWRAREFGPLLSRAREVEIAIRDRQLLVHEVEMEMRRGFQDAHGAYQRVMFRRADPAACPVEEPSRVAGAARPVTEFEKEALFQEWVQKSLGTNPDKMDDAAYSTSFEAFKSHMFRAPSEEVKAPNQAPTSPRRASPTPSDEEEIEEALAPIDARVKELYRHLVRRLHPDLRADGNTAASMLWHEVQEAYAASDVAQLEILLALCDLEANYMGEGTSLSQMHSLLLELERAGRALEKNLQEATGEEAWNFARTGPSDGLRLRVERQLKSDLASRMTRLHLLTETIAEWARGPVANPMRVQVRSSRAAK